MNSDRDPCSQFQLARRSEPLYFGGATIVVFPINEMELSRIRPFANKHCKFKLRSGKEVFGVIWEVDNGSTKRLFFSSIHDYEKLQHSSAPVSVIPLQPEEIVHVESIAS